MVMNTNIQRYIIEFAILVVLVLAMCPCNGVTS